MNKYVIMSNVFYVLTNKINMEHNIFKIGIHTGDRKKLLARYKTQLVSPQILRFIPHKHANLLEQTILAILDDKRTIFDSGKKSEWITYPKDDLLKLVDEEKDKCIVKTITTESVIPPAIEKVIPPAIESVIPPTAIESAIPPVVIEPGLKTLTQSIAKPIPLFSYIVESIPAHLRYNPIANTNSLVKPYSIDELCIHTKLNNPLIEL
jgi:hypothetical protein